MKNLLTILSIMTIGMVYSQTSTGKFFNESDNFFKKYVKNGKVDYKSIKSNRSSLDKLYRQVNGMKLSSADDKTKKAFYINAYNVSVIYQVVKYYPLKSPLDKKGFFDQMKHNIAGEKLTLNDLENNKIRKPYNDARIHFVLVCAAVSCPKLASHAYFPTKLNQQLDTRTKLAINDKTFIRVNDSSEKMNISEIFKWYEGDFTTKGNTVKSFINKYRTKKIPQSYSLGYYQYDWKLNGF